MEARFRHKKKGYCDFLSQKSEKNLTFFRRIVRYKLNSENISVFFSCNYEFISRNSEKKSYKARIVR